MSKVSITKSKLDTLANTISAKSGVAAPLTLDEMNATAQTMVKPTGTKIIVENGEGIDVAAYATVDVDVSGSATLITKSITANGTYNAQDDNADGYSSVTVSVSGGTPRTSTDLTVSGATVTAPAGVYAQDASKSVASGTVTAPASISGTSATVSTGTNTLTLSKTVSVTPTVSTAGYVASGTAGNSSISLTANVTTKAAATYYTSTSDQTISASQYLTGAQTIKGVSVANLTAANVKKGVTVTVGDSADADRVMSVTGTYEGGGSSKNVQTAQSTTRRNSTALGSITSLTCSTAGTYEVYWTCTRSNTSQTWGSQLYIGGTAYGTENTSWSNNVQNNHLTGVSIAANQTVAVYGRSRSGYYIYAPQLTIIQTA